MLLKAQFTMAPWDISSLGTQIPIFSVTRLIANNYVEKIICVGQFVKKNYLCGTIK